MGLAWCLVAKGSVDEALEMQIRAKETLMELFGKNKKHVDVAHALRYVYRNNSNLTFVQSLGNIVCPK